jgi:hypothetical protein
MGEILSDTDEKTKMKELRELKLLLLFFTKNILDHLYVIVHASISVYVYVYDRNVRAQMTAVQLFLRFVTSIKISDSNVPSYGHESYREYENFYTNFWNFFFLSMQRSEKIG